MGRRRTLLKRRASSPPPAGDPLDIKRPRLGKIDDDTFIQREFPSLPPEIHLRIVDYFCDDVGLDVVLANPQPSVLKHDRIARTDTLRALSQVCVSLRHEFLALAWQHVYACTSSGTGAWYLNVARALHGMSFGLPRHAYLAVHVQTMTVALTRTETVKVLPAFAQCLGALPNLHTLELVHVHSDMTTVLGQTFKDQSYPQIRRVVLPSCAHNILRACPEVREVLCTEHDGSKLIGAISKACKHVEMFKGLHASPSLVKRLVKAAPGLKELSVYPGWGTDDGISLLDGFKHLNTLELLEPAPPGAPLGQYHLSHRSKQVMLVAKEALKSSHASHKTIVSIAVHRPYQEYCCIFETWVTMRVE